MSTHTIQRCIFASPENTASAEEGVNNLIVWFDEDHNLYHFNVEDKDGRYITGFYSEAEDRKQFFERIDQEHPNVVWSVVG